MRYVILKASDYSLEFSCRYCCTIGCNPYEFSALEGTDNIEESSHEKIHIVASVSLEHGDGDCMDIVEFAVKMKANSIIEV